MPRKIDLPPTDLATYQYVQPIYGKPSTTLSLQQSQCKIFYDETRQTEYQIHVREGRVDKVTSPELQKTVACVSNHAMHGRLVQGTQVLIRLLTLHVRL